MSRFFDAESVRQKKQAIDERRKEEARKRAELLAKETADLQEALGEYYNVLIELDVESDVIDPVKGKVYFFYAPIRNPENDCVNNKVFAVASSGEIFDAEIPVNKGNTQHQSISIVPLKPAVSTQSSITEQVPPGKYPPSALLNGLKASFAIRQDRIISDEDMDINWFNPPIEHQV